MKALVVAAAAMATLVSAYLSPDIAVAFKAERFYRVEAWADGADVTPETLQATADVITKRLAHPGYPRGMPKVVVKDGGIQVVLSPDGTAEEDLYRHLVERRGDVEFRIRAKEATEDEHRDRRLQADAAPPPGFAWHVDEQNPLQALVEMPEAPLAAKLAEIAAKEPKDDAQKAALAAAQADLDKVRAESVFTNADIGAASVRRAVSTVGAQWLMHVSVRFEFKEERRAAFEKFTGANVGRVLCVVVEDKVHVAPLIKSALPGMGEIRAPGTGYTDDQAREMAAILECGPLPLKLVPEKGK